MSRRRGSGDEPESFRDAVEGVVPIADRDKLVPPPPPKPARRRKASKAPPAFEVQVDGERCEGAVAGLDPAHLRRLRNGEVSVDTRIDLHGESFESAREVVRRSLLAASDRGERCVLVIHGRGRRSGSEPILKAALPDWLTQAPLASRVLAFATAAPRAGGSGATAVLLRRRCDGNAR